MDPSGPSGLAELDRRIAVSRSAGAVEAEAEGWALLGDRIMDAGEVDKACFAWTHGYVLALQAGADRLSARMAGALSTHGRL